MSGLFSRIFVSSLLLAFLVSGCRERDRGMDGPACGDPGTHTVVVPPDGCVCEAGYVPNATGSACVLAATPDAMTPDTMGDAGAPDATPDAPPPPPPGTLREAAEEGIDCAAGCAAIGFPCTTTCDATAGFASYGYYDWDFGLYRTVHQQDLLACDDVPAPTHSEEGETYEIGRQVCCCALPEITTVSSLPADDRTCTQICADAGHGACADYHDWPNESANGGTLASYYRPATGSIAHVVMGCEANPPPMRRIAGADRELRDYRCACEVAN